MKEYLCSTFAANAGLPASLIFEQNLTLAEIMSQSDRMHNSVDLIEAFARTANALQRDYGVRVRLPTFTLDTPVAVVLGSLLSEIEAPR